MYYFREDPRDSSQTTALSGGIYIKLFRSKLYLSLVPMASVDRLRREPDLCGAAGLCLKRQCPECCEQPALGSITY